MGTSRLHFVESTHEYFYRGKRLPSVTEIVRTAGVAADYSNVPRNILQRAAQIGKRVHRAIELYHSEGSLLTSDDLSAANYLDGYTEFIRSGVFQYSLGELSLCCECHLYAGTVDLVGFINGRNAVIDVKTTNKLHVDAVELQLAAYSHLVEVHCGFKSDRFVLKLEKRGEPRLIPMEDEAAWSRFALACSMWHLEND
jgi:hypothetical protein